MRSSTVNMVTLTVITWSLLSVSGLVSADGQGDRLIWSDGSLLQREMKGNSDQDQDEIFITNKNCDDEELSLTNDVNNKDLDLVYNDNLKAKLNKIKVEVVAPGKELTKMMNFVSTKSRAMFLRDFERYFKTLNLGSTSRPMLLTHLGLEFASDQQLNSWYGQQSRLRIQNKLLQSCHNLLRVRDNALSRSLDESDVKYLEELKANQGFKLKQLVYITFKENLNLFMLEEFLLLCSRLEPSKMEEMMQSDGSRLGLLFKAMETN